MVSRAAEDAGLRICALNARERRWLGAIAVEHILGRSVLALLREPGKAPVRAAGAAGEPKLEAWLTASVASGLLVKVAPSVTAAASRDTEAYRLRDDEQRVLRELAASGELDAIALETQALLGARSVAEITLALQRGDLDRFSRRFAARKSARLLGMRNEAEWLRATACEPFDRAWFERTFRDRAMELASRVLRDSLEVPRPCHGLPAWIRGRLAEVESAELRRAMESSLREDAILRGEPTAFDDVASALPRSTTLGYQAAARFMIGDLSGAQQCLQRALGGVGTRPALPQCGAVAPVLALMLLARDDPGATAAAKRLVAAATTDAGRGAARALRRLLQYLARPAARQRRIRPRDLAPDAGAWEVLLSAFTAHLHFDEPAIRAGWSQRLVQDALQWRSAGYEWSSTQGLLLANDLSAEYCRRELVEQGADPALLQQRARQMSLWDLISPKPEWKRTLEALAEVAASVVPSSHGGRRVAWFVDMSDGSFGRPALQEYRPAAGGWSQGRRMSVAELYQHREGLPTEDERVLACTRETSDGRRELTVEAYEMLIGHPRVLDGMRGQAPVEVARGTCRVETEEEGGYLRVLVEPEGAALGINVVPETESRLVVYRVSEAMHRVIEVLPRGVRVPTAHAAEVLRVLSSLAQTVEVRSAQLGVERTIEPDSTPCLRIAPHAGAWQVQAGVRPFGDKGRLFVAGSGRSSVTLSCDGLRLRCDRRFDLERAHIDALVAACPTLQRDPEDEAPAPALTDEPDSWYLGLDGVLALMVELRDASLPHHLEWPESPALQLRGTVTSRSLHVRLRSRKGWYIASGSVDVDDVTQVALRELVRAPALAGGRFVRLDDGDYLEIDRRIRRTVAALGAVSSVKRGGAELEIHPAAVAALRQLVAPDTGFEVDPAVRAWLDRVEQSAAAAATVPTSLRAELRAYQLEGYRWLARLAELGLGACLADDMGLGKTVQVLAILLARGDDGPALVVSPTSVCANWVREMRRFAPALTPVEYLGPDRAATLGDLEQRGAGKVAITSYAVLQQDQARLAALGWSTVVLDEAQFIKNPESLRARAAFRLPGRLRIAVTGTPVENHYGDLWSIFHFINPGLLGEWRQFKRRFVLPIERDGSAAPAAELRELVQPYVLRRLKRDVLSELPPVTEVQHTVHLSEADALRYALLRREIRDRLFTNHGKQGHKLEVLAAITRLRRFCCHPRLVFPDAENESAKIQALIELVEELRENQHRALVFSQYVDFLGLVREQLDERGVSYEYLDGSTPQAQRQARVDAFQKGSASLFLISLKAGGFGVNLTAADYVIHLDPWWNPAVEAQATDRAHRIGQARRVTVYRLVTKDTIEEDIVELHDKKQRLARSLLDGGDVAKLDAADLLQLLGGDGSTVDGSGAGGSVGHVQRTP
jgi:superfamily II DNA or RNA helicase